MRENRTQGSARGTSGNWRSYLNAKMRLSSRKSLITFAALCILALGAYNLDPKLFLIGSNGPISNKEFLVYGEDFDSFRARTDGNGQLDLKFRSLGKHAVVIPWLPEESTTEGSTTFFKVGLGLNVVQVGQETQ